LNYSAKYLIKIPEKEGYVFRRSNGSHHLYNHPILNKTIVVPIHGSKDLPKGTFYSILRQAGIEKPGTD